LRRIDDPESSATPDSNLPISRERKIRGIAEVGRRKSRIRVEFGLMSRWMENWRASAHQREKTTTTMMTTTAAAAATITARRPGI
jgi:transposase-like protein